MTNRKARRDALRCHHKTTSHVQRKMSRLRQIEHDEARPQIRLMRYGY